MATLTLQPHVGIFLYPNLNLVEYGRKDGLQDIFMFDFNITCKGFCKVKNWLGGCLRRNHCNSKTCVVRLEDERFIPFIGMI